MTFKFCISWVRIPTCTNFYPELALGLVSRSNFYPEICLRVPAKMAQFLSGQCYGFSKNFENFYPDWDLGSKGTFRGPIVIQPGHYSPYLRYKAPRVFPTLCSISRQHQLSDSPLAHRKLRPIHWSLMNLPVSWSHRNTCTASGNLDERIQR